jgi:hypothetical protein
MRDNRRGSLRGDESYFASVSDLNERQREPYEHPLAQSLTASPAASGSRDNFAYEFAQQQSSSVGATPKRVGSGLSADFDTRPGPPDRTVSAAASIQTVVHRGHSHSRSVNSPPTVVHEEPPNTPGPFTDHNGNIFGGHLWNGSSRGRELMAEIDEAGTFRAKSVDRGLFEAEDKHAEPVIGMSNTVAPGMLQQPNILHHPRPSRSAEISPTATLYDKPLSSPLFFQPYMIQAHQITQSSSTPNVMHTVYAASNLEERPSTANRTPEGKTPLPRKYGASTPESFERAQAQLERKKKLEAEANQRQKDQFSLQHSEVPSEHCPPSPDDDIFARKQEEAKRERSSSSVNSASADTSQIASPTDVTSPISSLNLGSSEQIFPSVPSLPALVSGASSVSADPEGEFLGRPGIVRPPETVLSSETTPENLTPPLSKEPTGEEIDTPRGAVDDDTIPIPLDAEDEGYNGDGDTTFTVEDDDDSDSDEGLTMTRSKPKKKLAAESTPMARRGTNASVGSTETAKKVVMDS